MKIRPLLIVMTLLLHVLALSFMTYAWFERSLSYTIDTVGMSKNQYFAAGTGTEQDPFIISEAEHLYSLSRLHEVGLMTQKYYYKVADPITGDPVTIDFASSSLPLSYNTLFKPIGDHIYPFLGVFEGNYSIIKNVNINGSLKQDIGFFGFIGEEAEVREFFLDKPTIFSNPLISDSRDGFHEHGVLDADSYATGVIAGHILTSAILEKVYVIEPTINSASNEYVNGSKYGLIGYVTENASSDDGGLSNAYYFELTANWAYNFVTQALLLDATTPLYVETGNRLGTVLSVSGSNAVITNNTYNDNYYSISTLKVSYNSSFSDPVYLYDLLVELDYITPSAGANYSRRNIDVIGGTTISNSQNTFTFAATYGLFRSPYYNTIFNARLYRNTIVLYVRATGDANLGQASATFANNAELSFIQSFVPDVSQSTGFIYEENKRWRNKNDLIMFGAPGTTQNINIGRAFAAVVEEPNGDLRVINPNTTIPDYYVFLLGISNSQQSTVNSASFRYVPASADEFAALYDIDIINNVNEVLENENYINSDIYYDYYLGLNQRLVVNARLAYDGNGAVYRFYLSDVNTAASFFFFDVTNISRKRIELYIHNQLVASGTDKVFAVRFSGSTYTVSKY